jgi:Holliday junction resolvasome RuvABC ATP-dependent DNA helicase subunit
MFVGPPSSGKTQLGDTVARILGLPRFEIQGNSIGTTDLLIDQFKKKLEEAHIAVATIGQDGGIPVIAFPPSILFIDEAHNLKPAVSQALLTATEERNLKLRTERHVADMRNVSWILATTDPSKLADAFLTRFTKVQLEAPELKDVVEILRRDNQRRKLQSIPPVGLALLAKAGHLIPREALSYKSNFHDYMASERSGERASERHVQEFLGALGVDESGLSKLDYSYLRLLSDQERPIGIDQAAAALSQPASEIANRIEPYFLRLGLIAIGPGGRQIVEAGRDVLKGQHASS